MLFFAPSKEFLSIHKEAVVYTIFSLFLSSLECYLLPFCVCRFVLDLLLLIIKYFKLYFKHKSTKCLLISTRSDLQDVIQNEKLKTQWPN